MQLHTRDLAVLYILFMTPFDDVEMTRWVGWLAHQQIATLSRLLHSPIGLLRLYLIAV